MALAPAGTDPPVLPPGLSWEQEACDKGRGDEVVSTGAGRRPCHSETKPETGQGTERAGTVPAPFCPAALTVLRAPPPHALTLPAPGKRN